MTAFALRNLRLFFRDKTAVFFSLMAVGIVLLLYVLFLGDVWADSMSGVRDIKKLMNSWIMAGLLGVTSVTTTMGAFGTMVEDRSRGISRDFYTAPVSSRTIVGGYITSAFLIGVIMSAVALVIAEVYLMTQGVALLSPLSLLLVLLVLLITTLSNASLVLFVVSFFSSEKAFATASTIIGTLIGFLTGIYLPIGSLPAGVQVVVKAFPPSHGIFLLRQIFMEEPLSISFAGAPPEEAEAFRETMGVVCRFGDTIVPGWASVLILLGTAAVFFALAVLVLSRRKRT